MIDWQALIDRRNAWIATNFPGDTIVSSVYGVMEELGELAHAHLKQKQGIRMNEDHVVKAMDAVGDIIIYLLGVLHHRDHIPRDETPPDPAGTPDEALLRLGDSVGLLCNNTIDFVTPGLADADDEAANELDLIVYYCRRYCQLRSWNFETIVLHTWDQVERRNWIENPNDADVVAAQALDTDLTTQLHSTTDAMVWAKQFMAVFGNKRDVIDEDLMVGWFANAFSTQQTETEARFRRIIADTKRLLGVREVATELDKELGVLPEGPNSGPPLRTWHDAPGS